MIELLAGSNMVGSHLFSDGFLDMHAVEEVPEDKYKVRTRWPLAFRIHGKTAATMTVRSSVAILPQASALAPGAPFERVVGFWESGFVHQ